MTCAFCELPEVHERTVAQNDLAWAFLGNMPITPGHTLVAPKRCVPCAEDMTAQEREAVEALRIRVCTALRSVFGAEGFNFAWNEGRDCGQSVPHFHLHIVPRKRGDAGIYTYEPREFLYRPGERATPPEEELRAIASRMREQID
jgi:histidine triad (HIT) family protein